MFYIIKVKGLFCVFITFFNVDIERYFASLDAGDLFIPAQIISNHKMAAKHSITWQLCQISLNSSLILLSALPCD